MQKGNYRSEVRPKKFLGQHFLVDESVALQITESLTVLKGSTVVEIGPGMGVLSKYLKDSFDLHLIELDSESVAFLNQHYPSLKDKILEEDVLHSNWNVFGSSYSVIGNFPYNISSQILFKVLEEKEYVAEVVGMFQKEVAVRITSGPGNKDYGILSVLLQAFYDCEYLFTVDADRFHPPPKVQSGVIRLTRNKSKQLKSTEENFRKIVKLSFNQRRKTLRNSLRSVVPASKLSDLPFSSLRPEQLTWMQFDELVQYIFD